MVLGDSKKKHSYKWEMELISSTELTEDEITLMGIAIQNVIGQTIETIISPAFFDDKKPEFNMKEV